MEKNTDVIVVAPPAHEVESKKEMDVEVKTISIQTDVPTGVPELNDLACIHRELVSNLASPQNKQTDKMRNWKLSVANYIRSKCGPKPKRRDYTAKKDFKKAKVAFSNAHLKITNVLVHQIAEHLKFQEECRNEMKRIERVASYKIARLSNICINEFRKVQEQLREVRTEVKQLKDANGVLHTFVEKNMHALENAVKVNRKLASPWCKTDDAVEGLIQEGDEVKNARSYFATVHQ
eukprot:g9632.t1